MHLGRNIAGSVGSYLPDVITEIWEPTRDFAQLKLPSAGIRSLVALSRYKKKKEKRKKTDYIS